MYFTCLVQCHPPTVTFPFRPFPYKTATVPYTDEANFPPPIPSTSMPAYCHEHCHYFYRTALRLLSISTSISPLYA